MNITGGKYNSRVVKAPDLKLVRPTLSKIRAGIFNVLSSMINFETSSFLDAFSGSGIMALEAISRGFNNVLLIEKNPKVAKQIKDNFAIFNLKPNLIIKDTVKAMESLATSFDVIFIDPPYSNIELYTNTINKIMEKNLLTVNGIIIVEHQKDLNSFIIHKKLKLIKNKLYGDTSVKLYSNIN